jgi:Zn-dependent M28 family amino/carboxypeptidase
MWISWTTLAVLAGLIVLCVLAYRVMIDVKPRVNRTTFVANPGQIAQLQERLMGHVQVLGGVLGERHLGRPEALQAAAAYIRTAWARHGLSVTAESFEVAGNSVMNLVVEQRGASTPHEIVVVGAHYDTAPGTPGANDNGTGVALLLEMARVLKDEALPRTIRYVAFVNEEPPHFFSERMGSRVHARRARERGDNIIAMLSLETLGYYSSAVGSQAYPFPFGLFYPRTGDFLAVVGNLRSRALVGEFLGQFMAATDFPVEGVATFEWIPGINWSDHWSFWKEGYSAVMLTDTAPFRYPEYHGGGDVPTRVTAKEFSRVAYGVIQAVRALAGTPKELR